MAVTLGEGFTGVTVAVGLVWLKSKLNFNLNLDTTMNKIRDTIKELKNIIISLFARFILGRAKSLRSSSFELFNSEKFLFCA